MLNMTRTACCDNATRIDHPRGDSTTRAYCRTCGIDATQAYTNGRYECLHCATNRFHTSPPAAPVVASRTRSAEGVAAEPDWVPDDLPAWMLGEDFA